MTDGDAGARLYADYQAWLKTQGLKDTETLFHSFIDDRRPSPTDPPQKDRSWSRLAVWGFILGLAGIPVFFILVVIVALIRVGVPTGFDARWTLFISPAIAVAGIVLSILAFPVTGALKKRGRALAIWGLVIGLVSALALGTFAMFDSRGSVPQATNTEASCDPHLTCAQIAEGFIDQGNGLAYKIGVEPNQTQCGVASAPCERADVFAYADCSHVTVHFTGGPGTATTGSLGALKAGSTREWAGGGVVQSVSCG